MAISTHIELAAGEIHVWQVDASTVPARLTLSAAERERAARRLGTARTEFTAAHDSLRRILGRYLGVEPSEVGLSCEAGEKPRLRKSELELSLSHRDGQALIAVSRTPVGVDLERADAIPVDEVDDLATFMLNGSEQAALATQPVETQPRLLALLFARKEAVLKALGCGFGDISLQDLAVGDTATGAPRQPLTIRDVELGSDFVGALATLEAEPFISLRRDPGSSR